ncbi:TPA: phosphoglycerate kinase [archaeon]|uniref:Phosphoglycerate kinase n=1 Tax=Candidatus Naiadarchaeum limnaeum TaxID=2756139 RepID=A0A832UNW3_9ARCH|nr:phosphoglycerate kinase [Candidatus Naiadarchaeum limnaeum]
MTTKEILTIDDFNLKNKTVLVRVDLNCPIEPQTGEFLDDRRIIQHAKTVKELSDKGAKVVVLAHQGRAGEEYDFTTLEKHAKRLAKHTGNGVEYIPDIIGPSAKQKIKSLKSGDILLLENVRFLAEENLNRPADAQATTHFVKNLAPLADYFVMDAFAAAHRSQPSLVGFTEVLPSLAGRILEQEIVMLNKAIQSKKRPSVFISGGAKVKDSLKVVEQFLNRGVVDEVLTCGLVGNIFLVAKGYEVRGSEYIEEYDKLVEKAGKLLKNFSDKIFLPDDVAMDKYGQRMEVSVAELPQPYRLADIGTKTIEKYKSNIEKAQTIIANGPAGIFEAKEFEKGTNELVRAISNSKAYSVVGGGHIATAVINLNLDSKISHVSTGGGACILYLAGEPLPAIEALKKAAQKFGKK